MTEAFFLPLRIHTFGPEELPDHSQMLFVLFQLLHQSRYPRKILFFSVLQPEMYLNVDEGGEECDENLR